MEKEKLMYRLNVIFQTYPPHTSYLGDKNTIRDYKLDVRDGNKALADLIDDLAHEVEVA